jgi:hypothetical protein
LKLGDDKTHFFAFLKKSKIRKHKKDKLMEFTTLSDKYDLQVQTLDEFSFNFKNFFFTNTISISDTF